jgi:hypothetical protein
MYTDMIFMHDISDIGLQRASLASKQSSFANKKYNNELSFCKGCFGQSVRTQPLTSQVWAPAWAKGGFHPFQKEKGWNKKAWFSDFYYAKYMEQTKEEEPDLLSVTEKFKHPCTNSITSILQSVQ